MPPDTAPAVPGGPAVVGPAAEVPVRLLRLDPELPPPAYEHPGDAGADLRTTVDVVLGPGERRTVPTGVAIALPEGFAGFVHPRSGLAARSGLTVVNAPGTVDAGYRGEIRVTLLNTDRATALHLYRGDRIAQLVVQPVSRAAFVEVDELPASVRGVSGFGSTGGFGPVPGHDGAGGEPAPAGPPGLFRPGLARQQGPAEDPHERDIPARRQGEN